MSLWALARATHLLPTIAVTAFATALAVAVGQGARSVLVAAAVLAGQCSIGWANDWLDSARDLRSGRRDKPVVQGLLAAAALRRAALVSVALSLPLSLASGALAGSVHMLGVGLGWAYDLGLKATPASVLAYAGAFGLLPVFVLLGAPVPGSVPWWVPVGGALLGSGAHFTNALPDLADDARTGVRGLPQRLGPTGSVVASAVLLGGGVLVVCLAPGGGVGSIRTACLVLGLAGVGAATVTGLRGRPKLAFPLATATAAATVVAFVASAGQT